MNNDLVDWLVYNDIYDNYEEEERQQQQIQALQNLSNQFQEAFKPLIEFKFDEE